MTRQVLLAAMAMIIALFSLLAGSGIGQAYHLYPIASAVVMGLYALFPVQRTLVKGQVRSREFFLALLIVLIFVLWPMLKGYKTQGLEYSWLLMLPYVVGLIALSSKDVEAIGLACGIFGVVVLVARLGLGIFGNWNRNDIAMAGFTGMALCTVVPWKTWGMKIFHKVLLVIIMVMVLALDSRSCVIGCLILACFTFGIVKPRIFLEKVWLRRLVLMLPAIIAVGTVIFQNSDMFTSMNAWSMQYFEKPIFNGRNEIWEHGVQMIREKPWLGTGHINNGYWHNCAITAMTAFGIVGYGVWVWYFDNIMVDAGRWREDPCLSLCIAVFLTIMVQQSFELGLISTTGSMMPYLILGIMLGRMRCLRER